MQKVVISPAFKAQQTQILDLIHNFEEQEGTLEGIGDRNVIKKIKLNTLQLNIKSFKKPNLFNKVVYRFFRKSKAQRSFENATKLQQLNIGTPVPIAYIEQYDTLFFGKSFYVSEHLDTNFTFRELIHQPDIERREEIIKKFTHFTYTLHQNNILFKDHSPGNTLIKLEGDKVLFYLVDLNRMQFKSLNFNQRIHNFCRLTPFEDMVKLMSEEYAQLIKKPKELVFKKMWAATEHFQYKYHRKRRLKKKLLFWK